MKTIFPFFLSIFILTSCVSKAERIIPFVNNIPYGIVIEYHENGNIRMELNIVKDVQQGITKSYFETGELEWEENYLDGDKKRDIQTIL
jgi:antitoxin component YwqK of YwqJK toxin-antitoxin module